MSGRARATTAEGGAEVPASEGVRASRAPVKGRESPRSQGPASGLPARGGSWAPAAPGNSLATRHGAYASPLKLGPRVDEVAGALTAALAETGAATARFSAAIIGTAIAGVRLERALEALDAAEPGELRDLDVRARGWLRQWMNGLAALGLTPASASRIGLNVALAGRGDALSAHLAENYAEREG